MATTTHVSRRSLLTATAATLAGTAVAASPLALAKGVEADPIFALIEAHEAAPGARSRVRCPTLGRGRRSRGL